MQKDIKLVLIKIYRYENQLATAVYLSISLKKVDDNLPTRATVPSYLIHSIFPFRFWFYGIDLYTTSWFSLKGVVDDYPPKILREVQKNTPGNPVPREKIIFFQLWEVDDYLPTRAAVPSKSIDTLMLATMVRWVAFVVPGNTHLWIGEISKSTACIDNEHFHNALLEQNCTASKQKPPL